MFKKYLRIYKLLIIKILVSQHWWNIALAANLAKPIITYFASQNGQAY